MDSTIIASAISGVVAVAVCLLNNSREQEKQNRLQDEKLALMQQELKYSIESVKKDINTLSKRVEKHNNVIDRTYNLEKEVEVLKSKG